MDHLRGLRIALDIGGTFTDVAAAAGAGGDIIATAKIPKTPVDPTDGALRATRRALRNLGARFKDVDGFIHGTTLATNALIERCGAKVASITIQGFRDILEIAHERHYSVCVRSAPPDAALGVSIGDQQAFWRCGSPRNLEKCQF